MTPVTITAARTEKPRFMRVIAVMSCESTPYFMIDDYLCPVSEAEAWEIPPEKWLFSGIYQRWWT